MPGGASSSFAFEDALGALHHVVYNLITSQDDHAVLGGVIVIESLISGLHGGAAFGHGAGAARSGQEAQFAMQEKLDESVYVRFPSYLRMVLMNCIAVLENSWTSSLDAAVLNAN